MSRVVGHFSPNFPKHVSKPAQVRIALSALFALLLILIVGGILTQPLTAQETVNYQFDIQPPAGASERFGAWVGVLFNGNVVITDPGFDLGDQTNVGAVYLYDGAALADHSQTPSPISVLTGSTTDDQIGSDGIVRVGTGNFVVNSSGWDNGSAKDAGASTWVNGATGLSGTVSSSNSLVGTSEGDRVGVFSPANSGSYVVFSPLWDAPGAADSGALTWANGNTGITGAVSASNSVISNIEASYLGGKITGTSLSLRMTFLTGNGNGVITSPEWGNGKGAATFFDADSPPVGLVSAGNSLVGTGSQNRVGSGGVTALTNGNYVVNNDNYWVGDDSWYIATWGNGETGVFGNPSNTNSIVGDFMVGAQFGGGTTALSDGDFVVTIPGWSGWKGSATWSSGVTPLYGDVSAANSLVGTTMGNYVGSAGARALANGNYVVVSHAWDNAGLDDVGAVTWGDGSTGIVGEVSATNSLIGADRLDQLGYFGVLPLPVNNNYVVNYQNWQQPGAGDGEVAGAVIWGDGDGGLVGPVTTSNSLHGANDFELVGSGGIAVLNNGNYVVASPAWGDGGAVTWVDGTTGFVGEPSAANSLVVTEEFGGAGSKGVYPLTNGNYVVASTGTDVGYLTLLSGTEPSTGSPSAANSIISGDLPSYIGAPINALSDGNFVVNITSQTVDGVGLVGAARWAPGTGVVTGGLTADNSLVGNEEWDLVGSPKLYPLENGATIVYSNEASNGSAYNGGAISYLTPSTTGSISALNSVQGINPEGGAILDFDFSFAQNYLIVGRPADNRVTIMLPEISGYLLTVTRTGSGKITGNSGGIFCERNCVAGYPVGKSVILTATPGTGAAFQGWTGGGCSGAQTTCTVTMSQARNVTATFTAPKHTVTVTTSGTGTGVVTSNPGGINCRATCSFDFSEGASVTLTADPDASMAFAGWSGDCSGTDLTCTLTIDGDKSAEAQFSVLPAPVLRTLAVTKAGTGSGAITSTPAGINCGATCSKTFAENTVVAVKATAAAGSTFTGWSGADACPGASTTCSVTLSANRSLTANFALTGGGNNVDVELTPSDPEGGTIQVEVVDPDVLSLLGAQVAESLASYPIGTVLKLTAVPNEGFEFEGWTGGLTGSLNPATVTVNGALSIGATFSPIDDGDDENKVWLPRISK